LESPVLSSPERVCHCAGRRTAAGKKRDPTAARGKQHEKQDDFRAADHGFRLIDDPNAAVGGGRLLDWRSESSRAAILCSNRDAIIE